ncbi:MAG: PhoH family protein [Candidatus Buchananbacteria bacterium]
MRQEVEKSQQGPRSIIGYGLKEIFGQPRQIYVVDTNVLVNDSKTIDNLQRNGTNGVVVPWIVLSELDSLKSNQDLSRQVSDVVRTINKKVHDKDPNFYIAQGDIRNYPDLDPRNPDHHIIAACLDIMRDHEDVPLFLVSNDAMVHVVGLKLGLNVEEYKADQVDLVDFEHGLPEIFSDQLEEQPDGKFIIRGGDAAKVPINAGAIISNREGSVVFAAIRKGNFFVPIRNDIGVLGISPRPMDNKINWAQYVALQQLMDPEISLITLHGEAGTGKTLMSIAAALKQLVTEPDKANVPVAGNCCLGEQLAKAGYAPCGRYRKVYIARPFIHLSNKDSTGFLPGDLVAKSIPWLAPLYDNIDYIASRSEANRRLIEKINRDKVNGMEILPLSFIRGRTLAGAFVIIDEAQNLTRSEMKTIVTRIGEDTKMVLVGDINQIDIRWIDKRSSGLTHVTVKMGHWPYFANTFLDMSVRSKIARDAAECL